MIHYGFIKPTIDSTQLVFGAANSLNKNIIQPDGQWDKYLPEYEAQATDKYDTYGCTVYGTQNALEILEKKLYGGTPNYSERYTYNLVPVSPPGADPHTIIDVIRETGLIPQGLLPFTESYDEFCKPRPLTSEFSKRGVEFNKQYKIGHEWVFQGVDSKVRTILMKQALTMSPLGVSVTAWHEEDGVYVDKGESNNHWCVCYGYLEANGKTFWKIFDSYDHSEKLLHPDHDIQFCKRYSIEKIVVEKKDNWFIRLIKLLWSKK
jgi:hypothetical protein